MADLDLQEMKMFAKWYGTPDLVNKQEFWKDCMSAYLDKSITLPMYDEPAEREAISNLVKCPAGECGDCCRYPKVSITQKEYSALAASTHQHIDILSDAQGNLFLDSSKGCQFLKNNICTVYSLRPAVCRSFPILEPKEATGPDGTPLKQIQMRIKCPAALGAVRTIYSRVCSTGKLMLLPDLSLIPVYENGKGVLGSV